MMLKQPKPHQIDFAQFHRRQGQYHNSLMHPQGLLGSMEWWGMGRGKTLGALWEARELMSRLRMGGVMAPKFMVICPLSATHTWRKECHEQTPDLLQSMVVYPYSQLHNAIKNLKYYDPRMIIFDESQAMKSTDTDRIVTVANFLEALGQTGYQFMHGRVLLTTGTPLPNNAVELYTSWAICGSPHPVEAANRLRDVKRISDWKKAFAHKIDMNWVIGKNKPKAQQKKGHGVKYEGVNNLEMLQKLLVPFVHFVEGSGDVPIPREIEIDLGLPDDVLLKDAQIERPEAYMAVVERLSRAKTPYLLQWVKDFIPANKEQLIVFAMNRAPLIALKEQFPKHVELVMGPSDGMTNAQRNQNLTDFQNGKVRILGMTYACGAESHNLQNCRVSLYHGFPWNDAKRRQAIARTARTGQLFETLHYFMMSGYNDHKVLCDVKAKGETERKVEALFNNRAGEESYDELQTTLASFI